MTEPRSLAAHLLFRGHPRCPHAKKISRYCDLDYCDINDKPCLLEFGKLTCPKWKEIQKEQGHGEQDSPNTS